MYFTTKTTLISFISATQQFGGHTKKIVLKDGEITENDPFTKSVHIKLKANFVKSVEYRKVMNT